MLLTSPRQLFLHRGPVDILCRRVEHHLERSYLLKVNHGAITRRVPKSLRACMPFFRRRNRHLFQRLPKIDAMPPRAGYRANGGRAISTFSDRRALFDHSGASNRISGDARFASRIYNPAIDISREMPVYNVPVTQCVTKRGNVLVILYMALGAPVLCAARARVVVHVGVYPN